MPVGSLHNSVNGVKVSHHSQTSSMLHQLRVTGELVGQLFPYGWRGALLWAGIAYTYGKIVHLTNPNPRPVIDAFPGIVLGGAIGGSIYRVPGTVVGMCLGIPAYIYFRLNVVRPLLGI